MEVVMSQGSAKHSTATIPTPSRSRYRRPSLPPAPPPQVKLDFVASASQAQFITSRADTVVFLASRGEGKTTAGLLAALHHAQSQPRECWPITCGVVRDTWVYLRDSTIASIKRMLPEGQASHWSEQDRICFIPPALRLLFFGMDQPADANRFQSLELGCLWIEEPAPAADIATGLPVEVFAVGSTSLRQLEPAIKKGLKAWHRCQITMNPPDEDHWVMDLQEWDNIEFVRGVSGEITSDAYRQRMRQALGAAGRHDLIARLVDGQVGQVTIGEAVTPEFSEAHTSNNLPVFQNIEVWRGWDWGLTPTCTWAQITPTGSLNVLDVQIRQNMGLTQFIDLVVLPLQAQRYSGATFIDVGDPAGFQREQSNSETSCATVLREKLGAILRPGPMEWSARRMAAKAALTRMGTDGRPFVQIDRDRCRPLVRALRGGWRYRTDGSGAIIESRPVKDQHSHPGDSWTYLVAVATGVMGIGRPKALPPIHRASLVGDWSAGREA